MGRVALGQGGREGEVLESEVVTTTFGALAARFVATLGCRGRECHPGLLTEAFPRV